VTRRAALALVGALLACAAPSADPTTEADLAPLCGPLATLAPRVEPASCGADTLAAYQAELADVLGQPAPRSLVRVEHDGAARVRAVCVAAGPGYVNASARRAVAEQLAALRARPAGPACVADARVDLFRYEAAETQYRERESRCREQTRVTRETQGTTILRGRNTGGEYGVYDREFERCMEYEAESIVLDQPGSTRPAIFVKPEIPAPPGASVYDAESRCTRLSRVFEKRAACIEAEGFERLAPTPR
jgi:hypothetical protein